MTVLCRFLDTISKGTPLFPRFFALCIPTSPFIQFNDFCTCFAHFCKVWVRVEEV